MLASPVYLHARSNSYNSEAIIAYKSSRYIYEHEINGCLTRINTGRAARVFGNRPRRNSRLIAPPPIIISRDPVALPRPKDPASRLLKGEHLGGPELLVPVGLVGAVLDAELVVVLDVVGDGDGPLADNDVVVALVAAGGVEIAVFGGGDAGVPFEVAVVVKGGEVGAGEGAGWVSGAPGRVLLLPICQLCLID